jgi:hypothetical protein
MQVGVYFVLLIVNIIWSESNYNHMLQLGMTPAGYGYGRSHPIAITLLRSYPSPVPKPINGYKKFPYPSPGRVNGYTWVKISVFTTYRIEQKIVIKNNR